MNETTRGMLMSLLLLPLAMGVARAQVEVLSPEQIAVVPASRLVVDVTLEKGRYTLPARVWTGWFNTPFADFNAKPPAAGEVWGFNAARNRTGQHLLWSDGKSVTDLVALGKLSF